MQIRLLTSVFLLACFPTAARAVLPRDATVLDPDIIWDVANPDSFAISPDGQQIAYISKGAVWVSRVDSGPPTRLAELPNTITAILAEPENREQRELANGSPHMPGFLSFSGPIYLDKHYVISLAWTPNQDGVVYAVRKRLRENSPVAAYHVMHASLTGTVTEIATIEGQFGVPNEYTTSFHMTRDRNFVVAAAYVPLIWDAHAARPRVTPYDYLLPSSTSGRFLGIEIDTRQLVLVDENFAIVERFAPTFPIDRRVELTWSDDEQYVVCCVYRPYASREWDGFRLDLTTGAQGPEYSGVANDRFIFTGNDGEVVRLGVEPVRQGGRADGSDGSFIAMTSHGDAGERIIHRFSGFSRDPEKGRKRRGYPPIVASRDASLFAMALPRPNDRRAGFHYHLIDRAGKLTPLYPMGDATYNTPYYPLALVAGDRIVARWSSTLFSVPIAAIKANDELNDE